jgi:toxin secretion/phage lysis holin
MEQIKELIEQFKFTNTTWTLMLPIILMAIDVLTGTINAWIKGEIKSSILRKGLGKKIGEIVVLAIGELFLIAMSLPMAVLNGISLYIIVMELISICENLEKLGVPIPRFVKKALASTEEKINEGGKDGDEDEEE